jgi:hypothetical protein
MERSSNGQLVRRSARISANKRQPDLSKYRDHIETLHGVAGELLMMTDTLDIDRLRNIIGEYENIVGELLGVGR